MTNTLPLSVGGTCDLDEGRVKRSSRSLAPGALDLTGRPFRRGLGLPAVRDSGVDDPLAGSEHAAQHTPDLILVAGPTIGPVPRGLLSLRNAFR